MRIKILIALIIVNVNFVCIQAQWQWANQIGSVGVDNGTSAIDASNTIYGIGYFPDTCYFGTDTLTPVGYNDLFLIKYNNNGIKQWLTKIGSSGNDFCHTPVIDNNNHCFYISGTYSSSLTIGAHTINGLGQLDIFLAKFDFNGTCIWLKSAGSISPNDYSGGLGIDSIGNVYWTGSLAINGSVDGVPLFKGTFLSKIDPSGQTLWARIEMTDCEVNRITIENKEIILGGTTKNDTVVFDTLQVAMYYGVHPFICKTDLNGKLIWSYVFGGNGYDVGSQFVVDHSKHIYVTGHFEDSLFVQNDTLTNNGKRDIFLAKLDSVGNLMWIKQSHATGHAEARDIAISGAGFIYIAGYFGGNAMFDTIVLNSSNVTNAFAARYDEYGSCLGARTLSTGQSEAESVNVDSNGDIILSGNFWGTISIGSKTMTSHGLKDIFVAKVDGINGIKAPLRVKSNNQLLIYANPNEGKCNITVPDDFLHEENLILSIYSSNGKLIQQKNLEMNQNKIKINLEAQAKGLYNAVLSNGTKSYSGKIVFE